MAKTVIDLSVKVSDGSFEAALSFPVEATREQREGTIKAWLDALQTAIKLSQSGLSGVAQEEKP